MADVDHPVVAELRALGVVAEIDCVEHAGFVAAQPEDRLRANADKLRGYADTHDRTRITATEDAR
ncbi:hypothetical protein [Nocardia sp. R7R-8]|uniref:hypothetical protein n=1 Tax=Nocardia sp. R7R-8 TaxID=3459304 RepID=UPI00403DC051